jgi:hypothetical protein
MLTTAKYVGLRNLICSLRGGGGGGGSSLDKSVYILSFT